MKRLIDLALASVLLIFLAPLLVVVAVWIRIDSRGPALFKQTRIGRGGSYFRIFKFRTMVVDAERLGGHSTEDGDPRITTVGRFIRRTSIDELPQLMNVITGDMSLVGPRPDVPVQRELYSQDEWHQRHLVRPGITGLAQATLRSEATLEERKRLDLDYVANASLLMDIKIMFLTIRQVMTKGGN